MLATALSILLAMFAIPLIQDWHQDRKSRKEDDHNNEHPHH